MGWPHLPNSSNSFLISPPIRTTLTVHPRCPKCSYHQPRTKPSLQPRVLQLQQPAPLDSLMQKTPSSLQCQSPISLGQQSSIVPQDSRTHSWNHPDQCPISSSRCRQSHSPSRGSHSCCSTSRSPLTKHSHQSHHHSPHRSRCSLTPNSQGSIELTPAPLQFNSVTSTIPRDGPC